MGRPGQAYKPRCYCTATLDADGKCPHGCDPKMAKPSRFVGLVRGDKKARPRKRA